MLEWIGSLYKGVSSWWSTSKVNKESEETKESNLPLKAGIKRKRSRGKHELRNKRPVKKSKKKKEKDRDQGDSYTHKEEALREKQEKTLYLNTKAFLDTCQLSNLEDEERKDFGTFLNVVNATALVKRSNLNGTNLNRSVIDCGTVLFHENGKVLGQVGDMFGPVAAPLYKLNFENSEVATEAVGDIQNGTIVYYYPNQRVLTKTNEIHSESYAHYLEHQNKPVKKPESNSKVDQDRQPNPLMAHPLFVPPDIKFISSMIDKNSPYKTEEFIEKSHAMVQGGNQVDDDEEGYPVDESYQYHSEDEDSEEESE